MFHLFTVVFSFCDLVHDALSGLWDKNISDLLERHEQSAWNSVKQILFFMSPPVEAAS